MNTTLSPAQAAHLAQVSRRTVTRAISAQALRATRDNKNQWRIRPEDLEAWRDAQSAQWAPTAHAHPDAHPAHLDAHPPAHPDAGLTIRVAELEAEARNLREQLDREREDLERERKEREQDRADREQERQVAQATAEDLRKRLDKAEARLEVRSEATAEVEDLRKRLEETEAWIAALTAPEKPQGGREGAAKGVSSHRGAHGGS